MMMLMLMSREGFWRYHPPLPLSGRLGWGFFWAAAEPWPKRVVQEAVPACCCSRQTLLPIELYQPAGNRLSHSAKSGPFPWHFCLWDTREDS